MKELLVKPSLLLAVFLLGVNISQAQEVTSHQVENTSMTTIQNFNALAKECAKGVHPDTMQALVRTESSFNPFAIGVVKGSIKQPTTFAEAVEAAKALQAEGKNFSMGLGQINVHNLKHYGLTFETVFEPCKNLTVASQILSECFNRVQDSDEQHALQKSLSCYYSGNFKTGFREDLKGHPPYVTRVKEAARQNTEQATIKQIPAINPNVENVPVIASVKKTTKSQPKSNTSEKVLASEERSKERAKWDAFGDW